MQATSTCCMLWYKQVGCQTLGLCRPLSILFSLQFASRQGCQLAAPRALHVSDTRIPVLLCCHEHQARMQELAGVYYSAMHEGDIDVCHHLVRCKFLDISQPNLAHVTCFCALFLQLRLQLSLQETCGTGPYSVADSPDIP